MAKATAHTTIKVTLTMNEQEARFLRDILSNIGGKNADPCREDLIEALDTAGFKFRSTTSICEGTIYFN
jgi:hypothetical protein